METSHTDTASAADRTTKNSIAFIDATDFGTNEVMVGRESAASLEQSPIVPRKRGATEAQLAPRGVTKILKLKVKYPGPNIEFEQEKKSGPAKAAKKNPCAPKQKLNQDYKANQAKPNPCGQPKAWALSRQDLCESTRFHSWQSGTYHVDGIAYGLLLDKDRSLGGYMDHEIIVCRTGGGFEINKQGESVQTRDHDFNHASVRCFVGSLQAKQPVDIVVGDNNSYSVTSMPHRYCVLGQFYVTAVWIEHRDGHVLCRIRLEKCDLNELGWWAPEGTPKPSSARSYTIKAPHQVCHKCGQQSDQVYEQSWYCLNPRCNPQGLLADGSSLTEFEYHEAFLMQRTVQDSSFTPATSILKELPTVESRKVDFGTGRDAWEGQVCRKCGRCLTRVHWDYWACETNGCDWIFPMQHAIVPLKYVSKVPQVYGRPVSEDICVPPIKKPSSRNIAQYRVNTFELLPGNTVTHFMANHRIIYNVNGPNELFHRLQTEKLGLRRLEMANAPIEGTKVTKHFAHNFGSPYKYIAAAGTTAFKDAPKPIMLGLSRLNWAAKKAAKGEVIQPFNELLLVAYMAEMEMGWHDDGEKGLGKIVASLSLGADCTMKWRLKKKYYLPKHMQMSKIDTYDPKKPVRRGSKFYVERKKLNAKYGKISATEFGEEKFKLFEAYNKSRSRNCPPLITIVLKHGDFMVMNGDVMQKYYEHCIDGGEKLRFAMTGRFIDPVYHGIPPDDAWMSGYTIDPANVYNGDD